MCLAVWCILLFLVLCLGTSFFLHLLTMVTIHLPVKSYIQKYLHALYGDDYHLSINDDFGILIMSCLEKKSYYNYKKEKDNRDSVFAIHVSISFFDKYGFVITEQKISQIHKALEYTFRKNIYRYAILNHTKFGIQYKKSILTFLQSYGISEKELNYDSLRKDFNRHKADIESKLTLT